jgi:menaquinone-dependent protoporphyrinogen oxidase
MASCEQLDFDHFHVCRIMKSRLDSTGLRKGLLFAPAADKEREPHMSSDVLVAYATQTGFTKKVANIIASTLREKGAEVDVRPVDLVTAIAPYRLIMIGSAIQGKRWLPEAIQFLQQFQSELIHKPVSTFLVCMTLAMPKGEQYRPMVSEFMMPVHQFILPVAEGCFAGGLAIERIHSRWDRFKFRLSVRMGVWSEGDHTNPQAIRAWVDPLAKRYLSL